MNVKRDGHIHSHYCPHGSNDSFESYIKKAIEEEIEEITFTEHMPMPKGIVLEGASSDFLETSSPGIEEINEYFKEANYYKEKYKNKIKINVGLEVDYLEGREEFTTNMLNEYGQYLDDAILSVHIGRYNGKYYAFHRPSSPELGGNYIWLAESPDRKHWGNHKCVATTREGKWDSARVGAGAPPIRTERGWLEIYHGATHDHRYCLGALLLDLNDPSKVISRSEEPIMEPIADYEQTGFFGNVVFYERTLC